MSQSARNWKLRLQQRQQQEQITTVEADASQGITDAAAAQTDVDELAVVVESVQSTSDAQTEALASVAAIVNTPGYFNPVPPYQVGFYCTTGGATIRYRINGGGWSTYTGVITLTGGQYIEAQGQAGGLADSGILRYPASGTV